MISSEEFNSLSQWLATKAPSEIFAVGEVISHLRDFQPKQCKYNFCKGKIDQLDTFLAWPDGTHSHLHCYIKVATEVSQRR